MTSTTAEPAKGGKHTPGEWLFDPVNGWVFARIAPLTKFVIATTESGTQDEQRANARLIAAAPDLLEACKCALVLLEPFDNPDLSLGLGSEALAGIRAAILKAEGSNA